MWTWIRQKIRLHQQKIYYKRRMHFASFFEYSQAISILDISCGNGDELHALHTAAPNIQFFGLDMSPKAIDTARTKYPWGTFMVGLAESLPYASDQFNIILSCMAFHHYRKPREVCKEVVRVLSTEGTWYLIDTIYTSRILRWLQNIQGCSEPYHFEKYYTQVEIEELMRPAGLYVTGTVRMTRCSPTKVLKIRKIPQYGSAVV